MSMALKPESIEKIKLWIANDGARIAGKKLVDQWLNRKIGLTSSDLADTATFASGLDDIESLLTQGEFDEAFMVAKDTAEAMLEDEGMGDMFEVKKIVKSVVSDMVRKSLNGGPTFE